MVEVNTNLDTDDEEIDRDQYLVFVIKTQEFGIQAMRVQEITAMMEVAEVPNAPVHVQGILNLRGRLVSVINFRRWFGFVEKEMDEDTRVIIMEHAGFPVGVIVDSVEEVIRIPAQKVQQIPMSTTSSLPEGYMLGVGMIENRLIILLDADRVLSKSEVVEPDAFDRVIDDLQAKGAGEEEASGQLQGG